MRALFWSEQQKIPRQTFHEPRRAIDAGIWNGDSCGDVPVIAVTMHIAIEACMDVLAESAGEEEGADLGHRLKTRQGSVMAIY